MNVAGNCSGNCDTQITEPFINRDEYINSLSCSWKNEVQAGCVTDLQLGKQVMVGGCEVGCEASVSFCLRAQADCPCSLLHDSQTHFREASLFHKSI